MFYRFAARIRGAGLLAERLSRCAPALSPSNSRKHIGYGNTPITFRRSRPLLVAQCNRGCRCILSALRCVARSPALTGPLSTGNRRQHRVSIGWLVSSLEAPKAKCGRKGGLWSGGSPNELA